MALVISTDALNRYGYRILTGGIDLSAYQSNPVLCYDHDTYRLPLGKMENLRVEGSKLVGDVVWDEEDEFAASAKRKYEKGMLNACSMRVRVLGTSTDPGVMLPGQERATVTSCELEEVSIVVLPGNKESVRLSAGQQIDEVVPIVTKPSCEMQTNKIFEALGLPGDATEEQATAVLSAMSAELDQLRKVRTEKLLAEAKQKGLLKDENTAKLSALAQKDPDGFAAMLEAIPAAAPQPVATITSLLRAGKGPQEEEEEETFEKMSPAALLSLKQSDPEKYAKLADAYQGKVIS